MPCPICQAEHKIIPPDGPESSPIAFIGEALGVDEDRQGRNFCGKTGRELNEGYLPFAGLSRPRVRVINTVPFLPCTPKHKLDITKPSHRDLVEYGAGIYLLPDLDRNHYKTLVPMGAIACSQICPDVDLELQHGIPYQSPFGRVFPMYHPAGGIHEPKRMLHIRTDWARLRKYLRGSLTLPTDQYPDPDYQECESVKQLDDYLLLQHNGAMACDTETVKGGNPFCITLSVYPGTGRLIRATNLAVLGRLQKHLDSWKAPILFHNWLFDAEVVESMGLRFDWGQVVDTMVKVFHLGNLPQGLKALSYREIGMRMQDFDDLVTPYSRPLILDYYRRAMCEEWSTPPEQLVRDSSGKWKVYKPQGFRTKLKRFWTDYAKNADKNIFEQWTKNWEEHQTEVQEEMGPWPGKCISYVPFEKALFYACRDADATLRLWPVLCGMESRVRRTVQENWREAA
jgi:uracil-DNA glycosylase family 4